MKKIILLLPLVVSVPFPTSAIASDITYQPVKQIFSWSGSTSAATDLVVAIPRIETEMVVTQTLGQCRPANCPTTLPGRFDAWQGFFQADERDRPAILSRVVLGIPIEVAAVITREGYLRDMPRSWQDFRAEMSAAQSRVYSEGLMFDMMTSIFEANGLANATALGYADAAACTSVQAYPCSIPNLHQETHQIGAMNRPVHFDVSGALLLPYETESAAIQISTPGEAPVLMTNDGDTRLTNQYQLTSQDGPNGSLSIELTFLNRPLVAVPSNLIVTSSLTKTADGLQATVSLDPTKLSAILAQGGRMELEHSLCRRDLLGGCAETVVKPAVVDISSGTVTLNYPASALKHKKKYHAALRIRAVGTPYFSSDLSDNLKTNKVDE